MPEICLISPVGECINVAEARLDRRLDYDDDDAKLKLLISAARQAAEARTKLQLLHARYKLVLNAFPGSDWCNPSLATRGAVPSFAIVLPHSPVVRIVAIEYVDMSGAMQTMAPSDYVVNSALTPAVVTPVFGKIWPIPMPQIASVFVTYDAGYASPISAAALGGTFSVAGPVTWSVGDKVQFYNSGGVAPAPMDVDQTYTIASIPSAGSYSLNDATGSAVSFTDAGTGRTYIGVVPEGIRSWMLLRLGSVYENREEVAILARGKIEALPYVDGLLDPYIANIYWCAPVAYVLASRSRRWVVATLWVSRTRRVGRRSRRSGPTSAHCQAGSASKRRPAYRKLRIWSPFGISPNLPTPSR